MQPTQGRAWFSLWLKGRWVTVFASMVDGSGPLEFPELREHPMPGGFRVNKSRAQLAGSAALRSCFCAPQPQMSLRTTKYFLCNDRCTKPDSTNDRLGIAFFVNLSNTVQKIEDNTPMRTSIEIDDKLMEAALKATGFKTKREVVEEGLRALIRIKSQTEIRKLRGKYEWVGDLDAMRRDRGPR